MITLLILVITYFAFFRGLTPEILRNYIGGFGYLAPFIYILCFTMLPIAFFPVPILALAAGLLFGFLPGTIYTLIGAVLNSAIMFLMAKVLAKDAVTNLLQRKLPENWSSFLFNLDEKKGFGIIFILRLIPAMPYNLINYGAGLTSIKFSSYMLATILGILPGTLVFLNIGNQALNIHNPAFMVSIILLILLTIFSLILGKRIGKTNS
ncbi:membrane protein [Clostridium sulfidigenes]|uniref:TVP38/TMEM64 family membrane protein n=1 Tax=Clostridium sulfidigenes TaxID=318464 RepID=A0A084J7G7_9CLOT|nr:TVP38/TMEM64 family protein [Clostridium sulfidigenes]KEZ84901.1 membrane protein [Clostridium sulfidigenes]